MFDATKAMTRRLDTAAARIKDSEDEVFGELRVTTTIGFGTLWLAPRMGQLYRHYPNLKIDLMLEERVLDLPMREADIAIRMKEPSQADLIRRRLMDVNIRLYASPEYLAKHGMPQTPAELAKHRLICQSPTAPQVSAGAGWMAPYLAANETSLLTVNNYFGILQAVRSGLGVGALPDYLTADSPELINVLPEEGSGVVPVYLAYPEELRHSKRVAVFRDFVIDEVIAYRKSLKT